MLLVENHELAELVEMRNPATCGAYQTNVWNEYGLNHAIFDRVL